MNGGGALIKPTHTLLPSLFIIPIYDTTAIVERSPESEHTEN